jgi:hypothetical protein
LIFDETTRKLTKSGDIVIETIPYQRMAAMGWSRREVFRALNHAPESPGKWAGRRCVGTPQGVSLSSVSRERGFRVTAAHGVNASAFRITTLPFIHTTTIFQRRLSPIRQR